MREPSGEKRMKAFNHIAIIVRDERALDFYRDLGFREFERVNRQHDRIVRMEGVGIQLELYVDKKHPPRVTNPEALGLRHFSLDTDDIEKEYLRLAQYGPEPIRQDSQGLRFFFVKDRDGLPVEIREHKERT